MTKAIKAMGHDELTALVHRGDLRQAKGDSLGALGDYEAALREAPDDPMLWNNRGVALASLGRYDEAIASYRKALEKRPRYWNAWFNLGKSLQRNADKLARDTGDPGGSEGRPADEEKRSRLAESYAGAIEAYDRALELDPSHASSLNNKALALRALHRHAEALEVFDAVLNIDPAYAHAWYNKGQVLGFLGFPDEARRCFEIAAELDPQFSASGARKEKRRPAPPPREGRRPAPAGNSHEEDRGDRLDLRDVDLPDRAKRKPE